MLDKIEKHLSGMSDLLCLAGGWLLTALALWIAFNTLLRKFFSFSFQGVDEIGGYTLAIVAAAGCAKAAFDRAHVRIDVFNRMLPRTWRAILDLGAQAALIAMMWIIVSAAVSLTLDSLKMGALSPSILRTPIWIPQALWSLGLIWFLTVLIWLFAHSLIAFMRRDLATVAHLIGHPDIEEEAAQEALEARERLQAPPPRTARATPDIANANTKGGQQ